MKLKCLNVIKDFGDVFVKGSAYESTDFKNDFCLIKGRRAMKLNDTWQGVRSLGGVVVLGVASFEIIEE